MTAEPRLPLRPIIEVVLEQYVLDPAEIHGVPHWARVLENGRRLAAMTGANPKVVQLFAVLHDSRRLNEGHDPDHGQRAAEFALSLVGDVLDVSSAEADVLAEACAGHTHLATHPDITLQTCWDADRLDLGRVGIPPNVDRLCTSAARTPRILEWANRRACRHYLPAFVAEEWGIDSA